MAVRIMPRKLETELFFSGKRKKRRGKKKGKEKTKNKQNLLKHFFLISSQFSYLQQVNSFLCFNQKRPIFYHQVTVRWDYFMRASKSCKTFCAENLGQFIALV